MPLLSSSMTHGNCNDRCRAAHQSFTACHTCHLTVSCLMLQLAG